MFRYSCLFGACLMGMGQVSLLICLPVFVNETGIDYGVFAGLVALGTGLFIVAAPVWGKISDYSGRKVVITAGLTGFIVSNGLLALMLISGSSEQVAMLLLVLSRVIYGLTVAGFYPAVQAWMVEQSTALNPVKDLSRVSAAISLGRLLGPLLPLVLLPLGAVVPVIAVFLLALLTLLITSLSGKPGTGDVRQLSYSSEGTTTTLLLKRIWPVLLIAGSVTTVFGLLQYLIAPVLQQKFHYSAEAASETLSLLMLAAAFSTLIAHITLPRLIQHRLPLALVAGGLLLLAGTLCLLSATDLIAMTSGIAMCAVSVALLTPVYTTLGCQLVPADQQGGLTGILSMIHTVGYTLGAMLAGALGLLGGLNVIYLCGALIVVLFSGIVYFIRNRPAENSREFTIGVER